MSNKNVEYRSQFGARLKAARTSLKKNQTDFANEVGIARDTLSRYERGELSPSLDVLSSIAMTLGSDFSADWLLFGNPEDLKEKPPVLLDNFGSVTRLGFQGRGTADVLITFPEILRFLEGLIQAEANKNEPDDHLLEKSKELHEAYLKYFYDEEKEPELIRMVARSVIAINGVRLVPEFIDL